MNTRSFDWIIFCGFKISCPEDRTISKCSTIKVCNVLCCSVCVQSRHHIYIELPQRRTNSVYTCCWHMCVIQPILNLLDSRQSDQHQNRIPAVILFRIRFHVQILLLVPLSLFWDLFISPCLCQKYYEQLFSISDWLNVFGEIMII